MMMNIPNNIEDILVKLANENRLRKSKGFKIKRYQRLNAYYFDQAILKRILKEFDFKDCGTIYDYSDDFETFEPIRGNGVLDFSMMNRLAISKKNKSLVYYNKDDWSIDCIFLINVKKLKKFTEIVSRITLEDDGTNDLKGYDFSNDNQMYMEISDSRKDETKKYEIQKKYIQNENLVFDEGSVITKVKGIIDNFFTEKTKKIYNKIDAPYKRGIILYGEPGNGKSAMIREIIREVPKEVIKIIVKRVRNLADVLAALTSALKGKQAIIILEDMDSMIRPEQRSEVLNILDGVEVNEGMVIIGTTNYLDKLDAGFIGKYKTGRAGRFDKVYEIKNPDRRTRKLFFESKHLDELFEDFEFSKDTIFPKNKYKEELENVFVENSENLPMASLKELVTSVAYKLAYGETRYIEDALKDSYSEIISLNNKKIENFPIEINSNVTMMPIGEPIDVEPIKLENNKPKRKKIKIRKLK